MTAMQLHMCLDVRGALKTLMKSRAKRSAFTDTGGQPMTRMQAIDGLMDELSKGHEVVPMHKGCDSPCRNSAKCKGFDFKGGGCPGHPVEEGSEA